MNATTVQSSETLFPEDGSSETPQVAPAQVAIDHDGVRAEARLWKSRVKSELNAKIEMFLFLVLGVLGLGITGYGIERLASFVNSNAMDHLVTALLR
jgi:hypothetical protein